MQIYKITMDYIWTQKMSDIYTLAITDNFVALCQHGQNYGNLKEGRAER